MNLHCSQCQLLLIQHPIQLHCAQGFMIQNKQYFQIFNRCHSTHSELHHSCSRCIYQFICLMHGPGSTWSCHSLFQICWVYEVALAPAWPIAFIMWYIFRSCLNYSSQMAKQDCANQMRSNLESSERLCTSRSPGQQNRQGQNIKKKKKKHLPHHCRSETAIKLCTLL